MQCNICNSTHASKILQALDYSDNQKTRYNLFKCVKCGLVFVHPLPSLKQSYNSDYRPHQKPKKKISSSKIKRLSKEVNNKTKGKILDLGCGSGSDLRVFKKIGWKTYGVETNPIACDHAQKMGLNIQCGTIFDARFTDNYFDIVRLRHVLEHLDNPYQALLEIKRILKPGGKIIITTPNITSFNFAAFKNTWYHLDAPRHLFLFNIDTLKLLASNVKLKTRKILFDSGTKGLRESIQRWLLETKKIKINLIKITLLKYILIPFSRFLDSIRWGDTIIIILTKPQNDD